MILTTAAIVAQATPVATATPDEDKITALAKAWLISLMNHKLLDPSSLDDKMTKLMTPEVLNQPLPDGWVGDPSGFDLARSTVQPDGSFYVFDVAFKSGKQAIFIMSFDTKGKINGLRIMPPQ